MQNGLQDNTRGASGATGAHLSQQTGADGGLAQKAEEGARKISEAASAAMGTTASMIEDSKQAISQKVTEASEKVFDSGDILMRALTEQVRAKPILALGAAVAAGLVLSNLLKN